MYLILSQIVFLIVSIFLLYLLTWFLPTDSPWSPWWATSKKTARKVCKLAGVGKKDIFYELGSGTGTTVVIAAKEFGAKAIGIESDMSRFIWSRWKAGKAGVGENATFFKKNFFDVSLREATVVYLYLVPRVIKKLKPKLLRELKPGTRVVSYTYFIDYLEPVTIDEDSQIYVYKINSKKIRKKSL